MQGGAGLSRRSPPGPEQAYRCAAAAVRSTMSGASSTTLGGLPMVPVATDTPATLRVTVTANHIAQGRRESCYQCPIALAIISAGVRWDDVAVGRSLAWVNDREYALPDAAAAFIERFDEGEPVEPFAFELVAS